MSLDTRVRCHRLLDILSRWADGTVTERMLRLAAPQRLTAAQYRCLSFLAHREQCCIGELALALAVSDPAATKLVDRLQGKGFVTRSPRPDDRRVVLVTLTGNGAELAVELGRGRDSIINAATTPLSSRAIDELTRGLERLLMGALDSPEIARQVCLRCGDGHSSECVVNRAHIAAAGCEMSWP